VVAFSSSLPCSHQYEHLLTIFQHIKSYPAVSDALGAYSSNPLGQKSIAVFSRAYNTFYAPIVPYLQGPYSYVAPYVAKADSLGDDGLTEIDKRVPILKEDTEKVKGTVREYALFPLKFAGQSKDYVYNTFNDQYNKSTGDGISKLVKGVISTELKLGVDAFNFLMDFINRAPEAAKSKTT
jgi:hypothetical protein